MPASARGWRRFLKIEPDISTWQWFVDRLRENWVLIVSAFGSGGVITYFAALSKWLEPWGPIGWASLGLASALVTFMIISISYYIYASAKQHSVSSDYVKLKIASASVNVLAPIHQNERIALVDFFHPFYKPSKFLQFENCDLMGPCNTFVIGATNFNGCKFFDCEMVIVKENILLMGAAIFDGCHFINCHLYRITLLVTAETYKKLPQAMKDGTPVISDGKTGV